MSLESGLTALARRIRDEFNALRGERRARAATTQFITLAASQIVDGVSLAVGELCLVKDQPNPKDNGVYKVQGGPWTRAKGFDTSTTLAASRIEITGGTVNGGTQWTTDFKIWGVVGTTAVNWFQVRAPTIDKFTDVSSAFGELAIDNTFKSLLTGDGSGGWALNNGVWVRDSENLTDVTYPPDGSIFFAKDTEDLYFSDGSVDWIPWDPTGAGSVGSADGCVSIRRSAANQSIGDSAWGIPSGDVVEYIDGFTYDYATGAFLCKKDGVYEIDLTVMWLPNVTGRRLLRLYKSATPTVQTGTVIDQSEINPAIAGSGAYAGQALSAQVKCSAGDYLVPQVWQSSGASLTMLNSAFKFQSRLPQIYVANSTSLPLQRVRLRRLGAQSFPSATTTWIPWDTEDEDTHGMWTSGPNIVVPAGGGGTYRVTAKVHIGNVAGMAMLSVGVNGVNVSILARNDMNSSPFTPTSFNGTTEIEVNDGDNINIGVYASAAASSYPSSPYYPEVIVERVATSQAVVARADSRPIGEITMFGGAAAPAGWLVCDGSNVPTATYPDLYASIGHAFNGGASPGAGLFKLPNFVDKFPRGAGATALGSAGGSDTTPLPNHVHPHAHTHTMPDHSHGLSISNNAVVTGAGSRTNSPNTLGANSLPQTGAASVANTSNPTTTPAIDTVPGHVGVKYIIKAL